MLRGPRSVYCMARAGTDLVELIYVYDAAAAQRCGARMDISDVTAGHVTAHRVRSVR